MLRGLVVAVAFALPPCASAVLGPDRNSAPATADVRIPMAPLAAPGKTAVIQ
jgi:hypothetical protein